MPPFFGSDIAAEWLDAHYAIGKSYIGLVSFAVTFLAVAIGVHLLGRILEKVVDISALKPLDRLGGMISLPAEPGCFGPFCCWSCRVRLARIGFQENGWPTAGSGLGWMARRAPCSP